MVGSVIVQILITIVLVVISIYVCASLYMKGFINGMRHEALGWMEALSKVQPPNWQSLPVSYPDQTLSKEKAEDANKVFVAAFKAALDVIRNEIAVNRIEALTKGLGGNDAGPR